MRLICSYRRFHSNHVDTRGHRTAEGLGGLLATRERELEATPFSLQECYCYRVRLKSIQGIQLRESVFDAVIISSALRASVLWCLYHGFTSP